MRALILGGTTEASALARRLRDRPGVDAILSLAGRTDHPLASPIPVRTGGFGGAHGLARYLAHERIAAVVDATHPFAAQISANAAAACTAASVPLVAFTRPAWRPQRGDRWIAVADIPAAVAALGPARWRVLLTIGRQALAAFAAAPQHVYVVRSIERPDDLLALPEHRLILARGPFSVDEEAALMRAERIDIIVSKNSGGAATYAKIEAARRLGRPVVMIERPQRPDVPALEDIDDVLGWIESHRPPA